MRNKCLYCYEPLNEASDYHKKCSLEFFGSSHPPKINYSIDEMNVIAQKVVERSITIPGVQPKISMSLVKEAQDNSNFRFTIVGAFGGNYILKPPSSNFPEMPQNEHVTMRIAEDFNIQVVPSGLIRLASGELSYITKRVDRYENGEKIHMLDMFQITEAYDKYRSSMEKVGKALNSYSKNTLLDKIFYYELSMFSFLFGNNDMHLKNFSMIKKSSGWTLAPAYDLLNVAIILPEDSEELALTLDGKKRKLKQEHFVKLGKVLDLTDKQIDNTLNRMIKNKQRAKEWVNKSFLSENMKSAYKELLETRYLQLDLY